RPHAEAGLASEIKDDSWMRKAFGGDVGEVQRVIVSRPICNVCATYLRWYTGSDEGINPGEQGYLRGANGEDIELNQYRVKKYQGSGDSTYEAIVNYIGEFPVEPPEGEIVPPR